MENNSIEERQSNMNPDTTSINDEVGYSNVFRRDIKDTPRNKCLAQHKLWLNSINHEYPMPYRPYRIGVYIRYYKQTKYDDETYLEIRKKQFAEEIALCPRWTLVGFYVDHGMSAPRMESSPEWCRLLEDCFSGKIDLIVTQTVKGVSNKPEEMAILARILATQKHPIGMYFVSEDIFTLASYYKSDLKDQGILPSKWRPLPDDGLDELPFSASENTLTKDKTEYLGEGE